MLTADREARYHQNQAVTSRKSKYDEVKANPIRHLHRHSIPSFLLMSAGDIVGRVTMGSSV